MIIQPKRPPILIQTRRGNQIECEPPRLPITPETLDRYRRQLEAIRQRLQNPAHIEERRGPTEEYNCHGLTFLSRRAWLSELRAIDTVLEDDGYRPVRPDHVQPGDIAIYRDDFRQIDHTGIVAWVAKDERPRLPWVLSKWAHQGEYLHRYNDCPYDSRHVTFMREGADDT
jgi:hypothetical protein